MTHTIRDEASAAYHAEPQMSRRDRALMSSFDPHPDDVAEPAAHLMAAPGVDVLAAFTAEVEAMRAANERNVA